MLPSILVYGVMVVASQLMVSDSRYWSRFLLCLTALSFFLIFSYSNDHYEFVNFYSVEIVPILTFVETVKRHPPMIMTQIMFSSNWRGQSLHPSLLPNLCFPIFILASSLKVIKKKINNRGHKNHTVTKMFQRHLPESRPKNLVVLFPLWDHPLNHSKQQIYTPFFCISFDSYDSYQIISFFNSEPRFSNAPTALYGSPKKSTVSSDSSSSFIHAEESQSRASTPNTSASADVSNSDGSIPKKETPYIIPKEVPLSPVIAADPSIPNPPILKETPPSEVEQRKQTLDARFVVDVNIPDGTALEPLTQFHKVWKMVNNGDINVSTSWLFMLHSLILRCFLIEIFFFLMNVYSGPKRPFCYMLVENEWSVKGYSETKKLCSQLVPWQ